MRYRIALCGFGEFEYRALHFSFDHRPSADATDYEVVDALAEADFAVVDADSQPAVKGVIRSGRVAHAVFVGMQAPGGASFHLPRPIDPTRVLRLLDELSARYPESSARRESTAGHAPPTLDDVLPAPTDALAPIAPACAPLATPPASALPQRRPDSAAKAAARTAARRARRASSAPAQHQGEPLRDVLVLDADEAAGTLLCTLLEHFGFRAHRARSVSQADEQLAVRAFAALFLDISLDVANHSEGPALLQRIQDLPVPQGCRAPVVLIVSAHLQPVDRVRAALAGAVASLAKPVTRGDVARALEGSGVPLPTDARRL